MDRRLIKYKFEPMDLASGRSRSSAMAVGARCLNVDQDPAELEGAEEVKLEGNDRIAVAKLNAEQRWALRTLARSPNGCPEALMLAYRFTDDMLAELAVDGLLTAQQEHVVGRSEMVV